MHSLFVLLRFYPYWALPAAFVIVELGMHYRRRKQKTQWVVFGISGVLSLTSLLWIVFRGDLHSDRWVRILLNQG